MEETSGEWPFGVTAEDRSAEGGATEGNLLKRIILGLDPTAEALHIAEALPYYRDDNSLLRHYLLPKGKRRAQRVGSVKHMG